MSSSCEDLVNFDNNEETEMDTRCRLCGIANDKNLNIFQSSGSDNLLKKITSVYPIILYKNDPFPKYICKKCVFNVGVLYNDIQKIEQIQNEWIDDLRSSEPTHVYLRLLDSVQESNRKTQKFIKTAFQQDVEKRLLYNSMVLDEVSNEMKVKPQAPLNSIVKEEPRESINSFSFDYLEDNSKTKRSNSTNSSIYDNNGGTQYSYDSDFDDEIVLNELNNLPYDELMCPDCGLKFDNESLLAVHRTEHLSLSLPKIFPKKLLPKSLRRGRMLNTNGQKRVRCLNCWKLFTENKEILNHWSLMECDYFCNLCGMDFPNSPKDLREHTIEVHGVTYRSLKVQKEIISKSTVKTTNMKIPLHMLSHKTLTSETASKPPASAAPIVKTKQSDIDMKKIIAAKVVKMAQMAKQTPKPDPKPDVPVRKPVPPPNHQNSSAFYSPRSFDPNTCPICNQRFQNGKARNSHMRIHKPQFGFGEVLLPPNSTSDPYSVPDTPQSWKQQQSFQKHKPPSTITKLLNSNYSKYPRQNHMPSAYSQAPLALAPNFCQQQPRGVRTKVVPQRENSHMAGPSVPTAIIKVKSLNDLQNSSSTFNQKLPTLAPRPPHALQTPQIANVRSYESEVLTIKPEPMDDNNSQDEMITSNPYNENENFEENDPYTNSNPSIQEDNNKSSYAKSNPYFMSMEAEDQDEEDDDDEEFFASASLSVCDICEKCFINDDDLRLHKTQVHKV